MYRSKSSGLLLILCLGFLARASEVAASGQAKARSEPVASSDATIGATPQQGNTRISPIVPVDLGGQCQNSSPDLGDTRNLSAGSLINNLNVSSLTTKWVFTTGGSVSATPAVADGVVYFPDWAGNLYAVDGNTGKQIWSRQISSYDGVSGAISRVTPAVVGNELIFGDNLGDQGPHQGANLIAVNRLTGNLLWITQVDPHAAAIITGSAVVYKCVVYQGISSDEEQYATSATYTCCTFRGSVVAANALSGKVIWQTYDLPDNKGAATQYSGNGIWQTPVIDSARGLLYIGTGNNYSVPANVSACRADNPASATCDAADDYFDAVMALDLRTGAVKWAKTLQGYDVWTVSCAVPNGGNPCPYPPGEDWDFGGAGGNLLPTMVGFGQKSGVYRALNPADGSILWDTSVGPGGSLGGIQWGTATDGQRIYMAITNNNNVSYTLASGQTINWGSWSALDTATGKILWQTADPSNGAWDMGAVSVANGVMFAGSLDGHMYALDAATGKVLWSFLTGGSVIDSPAIAGNVMYWGSGYDRSGGTNNNKVYAFSVAATPQPITLPTHPLPMK